MHDEGQVSAVCGCRHWLTAMFGNDLHCLPLGSGGIAFRPSNSECKLSFVCRQCSQWVRIPELRIGELATLHEIPGSRRSLPGILVACRFSSGCKNHTSDSGRSLKAWAISALAPENERLHLLRSDGELTQSKAGLGASRQEDGSGRRRWL